MSSPILATCLLALRLPESQSLKDKRQVLRSMQSRMRERFSVTVAETGSQDKWQSAELLIAYAASDARHAQEVLSKVIDYAEGYHFPVELVQVESDLIYPF